MSTHIKNKFLFFLVMFSFPVLKGLSQENNPAHYFIDIGGFATSVQTGLRIDASDGSTGTELQLEDRGLDANPTILRLDGLINLKESHSSFSFTGLIINRSNTYTLLDEIAVGDSIYHPGIGITSKFNTAYIGVSYRYTIFKKKTWEAGASAGLRILNLNTEIKPISDNSTNSANLGVTLPAPVLGLYFNYGFTPDLIITTKAEFLKLTIAGITGIVFDSRIAARYYFWKDVCAGVAYSYSSYDANNVTLGDKYSADIGYSFSGFTFFLGYRF